MYQVKHSSSSTFVPIRGLQYHVRQWGQPELGVPPLFMLHGWMDVSASFQFVVDAMARGRWIIAPDWRGYGLTTVGDVDNFWFPDYLADLDNLIDHFSPHAPIDLVGHSMGGHVAMLYSGIRPTRVRRLINLEGFGMAATQPQQAPTRYAQWMDELKAQHRGEKNLRSYDNLEGVANRLITTNPRLSLDKAKWLAQHWAAPTSQGQWAIRGHSAHKVINAQLYQVAEAVAIYQRISAPTLMMVASDDSLTGWWKGKFGLDEFVDRIKVVAHLEKVTLPDTGHMLHHDQPQSLANQVEAFLARP